MADIYKKSQNSNIEYIAVLDLGSESMFAFLGKKDMTELKQIDLQDESNIKSWTKWDIDDVKVYKNPDGKKSLRLKNKIAIATNRVDAIIDKKSHAEIDFNRNYTKTIFQLFQENTIDGYDYMCNPKVIYAKGAKNILPTIKDDSGKIAELKPDEYLKHLTTQIANNLILKSKQLKGILPEKIKLVVTIPNIYSLTHAKELIDFLIKHTHYGEVGYIYESDAVLYASLTSDFNSFEKNTKEILSEKFQSIKNKINKNEKIYLISHDIGKGTTDLSLFTSFPDENNKENKHIWINSRTGLTKAGNALDYIFVRFFEEKILKVFYIQNPQPKDEKKVEEAFSFITKKTYDVQYRINEYIQEVIFRLKKNIEPKGILTNTYRIPKQFYREISTSSNNTNVFSRNQKDSTILKENLNAACEEIVQANISNGRFNESNKETLKNELYDLFIKKSFKVNILGVVSLPKVIECKIDDYINEIGNFLPKILKHNAKQRAEYLNSGDSFQVSANTFVVISGQASQFKPLKNIITSAYYSYFRVKEGNLIFLEDNISKQICAVGGFLKEKTKGQHLLQNEDELLADYYLSNVGTGYMKLNYKELYNGNTITYNTDGEPILYYYSILNGKDINVIKHLFQNKSINIDNYIAFIRGFSTNGEYNVKYISSNKHFEINGVKIELGATVDNDESINQNVWPEILIK